MALTQDDDWAQQSGPKSVLVLLFFSFSLLWGEILLKLMGISEAAFQIAGGFLLMIAAVEMVVAHHTGMTSTTAPEEEANLSRDITVFPLAIPLISGPGALATVILVMQEGETFLINLSSWALS